MKKWGENKNKKREDKEKIKKKSGENKMEKVWIALKKSAKKEC